METRQIESPELDEIAAKFESGELFIEAEEINPAQARMLLEQNANNRPLNKNYVKMLAMQMLSKDPKKGWKMAGDPIRVATDGRLLDGQHRLHAIIESNTTQRMIIIYNMNAESFDVMDTGRLRSASDVLHIAGFANSSTAASSARMIINYERAIYAATLKNQGRVARYVVTNAEILDWMQNHDLNPYIKQAEKWCKKTKILSKSHWVFFYYILSQIDADVTLNFLESLASGANLSAESPILLLRNKMSEYKTAEVNFSPQELYGLIIKTWNMHRTDRTVKMLIFNFKKEGLLLPV